MGRKISLGMITGFATGYAVKKVGKVVLLGAGIIFVSVQILSYLGYVETVRWDKVEKDLVSKLDTDGSGELTTKVLCVCQLAHSSCELSSITVLCAFSVCVFCRTFGCTGTDSWRCAVTTCLVALPSPLQR